MILTWKTKLRPTAAQHRLLGERLERQRLFYNAALQERRDAWRLAGKSVTRFDQQKSLAQVRADDPDGHGADPVTMGRWTPKRVDDAMTGFYGRVKRGAKAGFPRFRAMGRWRSFGLLEPAGFTLEDDRAYLKGMDRGIRLNRDRPLPSDARLLTVVFTRQAGHWWLCRPSRATRSSPTPRLSGRGWASTWASRRLRPCPTERG